MWFISNETNKWLLSGFLSFEGFLEIQRAENKPELSPQKSNMIIKLEMTDDPPQIKIKFE